ncbi:helix-turn-helix domain-containing protein [Gemmata sp. G18]|uniref:Helix-turn-helix domain-containing protein n=1 Tax=Gemmata palustris TaxID=2822762 RepID=A0ABS5BPN8_9BACT|nr:helix-turn-helix domain-containing protein [Gemmata palustris]
MAKRQRIVSVTAKQRDELDRLLRRPSVAAGLAKRARAILLLAGGVSVSATGRLVAMQRRHLYKWIERFRQHGVAGLADGKRTGRPPVFSPRSCDPLGQDRLRTA